MSSKLSERIQQSQASDLRQQVAHLELLRELRQSLVTDGASGVKMDLVNAALMLTDYLAHTGGVGGDETVRIVGRLVAAVEVPEAGEIGAASPPSNSKALDAPLAPAHDDFDLSLDLDVPQEAGAAPGLEPGEGLPLSLGTEVSDALPLHERSPMQEGSPLPQELVEDAPASLRGEPEDMREIHVINDMMLGEILVQLGIITSDDIQRALNLQLREGLQFGESILRIGAATVSEIQTGIRIQGHLRRQATDGAGSKAAKKQASAPSKASPTDPGEEPRSPGQTDWMPQAFLDAAPGVEQFQAKQATGHSARIEGLRPLDSLLLGEILFRRGFVSHDDVKKALAMRVESGVPIGEALIRMGAATRAQVSAALDFQRRSRQGMG